MRDAVLVDAARTAVGDRGGSGARPTTTLVHHVRDNGIRYGLPSMCGRAAWRARPSWNSSRSDSLHGRAEPRLDGRLSELRQTRSTS
ncbi:hypothetical protein ACH41E_23000 [Streptomyces sp. NPDC020412]|uniref:hypothetical protein n=1 Tax=Streptomyces sp. NPDC020412 TaxID=3365073 RepID=UPI0037A70A50